jgi:hypothetical protein
MTAPDLLYGLAAIGEWLGLTARQAEAIVARGDIPTFKMGRIVCARRSTLGKHFAKQERVATSNRSIGAK